MAIACSIPAPENYTATFPGCPTPVTVDLQVIRRMEELLFGSDADQQGLLHGRATPEGSHVRGAGAIPAFGAAELAGAVANAADPPIGYFRIRNGSALELTDQELTLAAALFRNPGSVVLLIERRAVGAEGCFFFVEKGPPLNFPLLRFPLDTQALARLESQRLADATAKAAEDSPPHEAAREGVAQKPDSAQADGRSKRTPGSVLTPIAIGVLLALTGFSMFLFLDRERYRMASKTARPTSSAAGVTLKAERQGADLRITWDRDSDPVANATSGILTIIDGDAQRQLALSEDQVRFGSFLYSPATGEVSIRLTTLRDNQSAAEGLILVLNPALQAASIAPPLPKNRTVAPDDSPVLNRPTRAFSPPVRSAIPAASASENLPAISPVARQAYVPALSLDPAMPPEPAPVKNAEQQTAPVLISESGLIVPAALRDLISGPVTVRVRVTVDEKGRVTRAEALHDKGVHALLLNAATNAALRCRFRPALIGQTPCPSEATIRFQVSP